MGNSASSSQNSSATSTDASREAQADSEPSISEDQVNQVFAAMKETFNRTTQELKDVEKELLLVKLCSKLQEDYPAMLLAAMDGAVVTLPSRAKKRKLSKDSTIIQKWAIPFELLLIVARFLPRPSLNNLKLTCKRVYKAIENPVLLTQPWGTKCPFQFPPPSETDCPLGSVIFSGDGSLVAVFTEGVVDDDDEEEVPGTLQVWDRHKGLLGHVECAPEMCLKPVFSPDNLLLLLCPREYRNGIRVCELPSGEQQEPITVSYHALNGASVSSAAFFDNTTIAFMTLLENGVKTCNVNRDNDQITLTEAVPTTLVDPGHSGVFGLGRWIGRLASFSSSNKDIVAFVYAMGDRKVAFHDRRTNTSVVRPIPDDSFGVLDLAFSREGNRLVAAHHVGGLSVFNCNVDTIEEIGEARKVILVNNFYRYISFSPRSATKIAVAYYDENGVTRIRIIDIESEQILCDEWNASSWKILMN